MLIVRHGSGCCCLASVGMAARLHPPGPLYHIRVQWLYKTRIAMPPSPLLPSSLLQISGLEEKKRESIMVVANQTKSKLQLAEDALHRVQVRWGSSVCCQGQAIRRCCLLAAADSWGRTCTAGAMGCRS